MKLCSKCKTNKELDQFPLNRCKADGRNSWCKECSRAYMKKRDPDKRREASRRWYRKNVEKSHAKSTRRRSERPDEHRGYLLKSKYGIDLNKYNEMVQLQGGLCKICCKPPAGRWNRLAVDHDHATGQVRGLLCDDCNRGLGMFEDDPRRLKLAALYLENQP